MMKNIFSLVVGISAVTVLNLQVPGLAVKLPDGTAAFSKGPDLIDVVTTFSQARVWGAKYYFTLKVPENSDEPLGKVVIQQRQGQDTIDFTLNQTVAFYGNHRDKGKNIPLATVVRNDDNSIAVVFDTPVSAGTLLTIGLFPRQNPDSGGVYLFGVTAFPAGEKAQGLYLGAGRLQFYDNFDSPLF